MMSHDMQIMSYINECVAQETADSMSIKSRGFLTLISFYSISVRKKKEIIMAKNPIIYYYHEGWRCDQMRALSQLHLNR